MIHYYVYSMEQAGEPVYIGMTTNPKRRAREHRMLGTMVLLLSLDSFKEAREWEDKCILWFRAIGCALKNGTGPSPALLPTWLDEAAP